MSSVTVEINGRETVSQAALEAKKSIGGLSSSVKQAQTDTAGLAKETQSLNGLFGGFVITAGDVVNAVQSIARAAYSAVEAFAEQERSMARFDAAMRQSKYITDSGAASLREYAQSMATLTGQDDEVILSMEAFLAAAGRTEEQIKRIIMVSADYSAATGKNMQSAIEQINKTFSGLSGELGEVIPALRNLTAEQLKNGGAITALEGIYGGFSEKMATIADVDLKNFKNAYADVVKELGKAVYPAIEPAVKAVTEWMQETLIPGIREFFITLTAIAENFPLVMRRVLELLEEMIRGAFSWDSLGLIFTTLAENFLNAITAAITMLPGIFFNVVKLMYNPIIMLAEYIADTLGKAFSGKMKEILSPGDFLAGLFEAQMEQAGQVGSAYIDYFKKLMENAGAIVMAAVDIFDPMFNRFYSDLNKIIGPTKTLLNNPKPNVGGAGSGPLTDGTINGVPLAIDDFYLYGKTFGEAALSVWQPSLAEQEALASNLAPPAATPGLGAVALDDFYLYGKTFGEAAAEAWTPTLAEQEALASNLIMPPSLVEQLSQVWSGVESIVGAVMPSSAGGASSATISTDVVRSALANMGLSGATLATLGEPEIGLQGIYDFIMQNVEQEKQTAALEKIAEEFSRRIPGAGQSGLVPGGTAEAGTRARSSRDDEIVPEPETIYEQVWKPILESLQKEFTTPGTRLAPEGFGQRSDFAAQAGLPTDLRGGAAAFAYSGSGEVSGQNISVLDKIINAISPVIDGFWNLAEPLASITAIINYGETIFSAMMDVLGPLINTVLQPIVGILRIIGTTLGAVLAPVISALSPVIQLVTEAFVWLYNNAIRPVANAFIWVGNAIYNAIVAVVNFIKSIVGGQKLEYKSMDSGMLKKIDFQDVTAAGTTSYGGTSGASASYQRPRDITVNVAVQTSALVGDDGISQFALIIGRELKAAGVLGMA